MPATRPSNKQTECSMLILTAQTVYCADETADVIEPVSVYNGFATAGATTSTSSAMALPDGDLVIVDSDGVADRIPSGIDEKITCLEIADPAPLGLLIGTEPPEIYQWAGGQAQAITSFQHLSCRNGWSTPWGGPPAVRCLAQCNDNVYADIHVGSVMRSGDSGTIWEPVTPDLHKDVHQVTICAAMPNRLYANTANAVYISDDCGNSWRHCAAGLPYRYGRAIAVHPKNPDCLLASVSNGPHAENTGQLFRSEDGGRSWIHVNNGFPATTADNIDTFHVCFDKESNAWVAVDRSLYHSYDSVDWKVAWEAPSTIHALACALPRSNLVL